MSIVFIICAAMLTVAAGLVLFQIERGPSPLDRMVGVDVMTAILLGGLALLAARTHRSDLVVVFVVVSVAGFLGPVAVARFGRGGEPEGQAAEEVDDDGGIDTPDLADQDGPADAADATEGHGWQSQQGRQSHARAARRQAGSVGAEGARQPAGSTAEAAGGVAPEGPRQPAGSLAVKGTGSVGAEGAVGITEGTGTTAAVERASTATESPRRQKGDKQ